MTYSAEVLADSPAAYWRLGDTSGTTMADSSGNSRSGTYTSVNLNQTGLLSGDADTAVTFSAAGGNGLVTYSSWMNSTSLTVEAWIKTTSATTQVIVCRDAQSGTRVWQLQVNSSGKVVFTNLAGGSFTGSITVNDGVRHHIVVTYDGSASPKPIVMYVDNVADVTSTNITAMPVPTATPICVGNSNRTTTALFAGTLDEVAFYTTVLSAARVSAHYTAGTSAGISVTALPAVAVATAPTASVSMVQNLAVTALAAAAVAAAPSAAVAFVNPTDLAVTAQPARSVAAAPSASVSFVANVIATATPATALAGAPLASVSFATDVAVTALPAWSLGSSPGARVVIGNPPTTTDTTNRDNGIDLAGPSPVTWSPAVVPTPARLQGFVAYDKARVYTAAVTSAPRQVAFTAPVVVKAVRLRDRILVGGVDVTSFRGIRTPCPDYTLIEPLLYGSGELYLPQVNAMFERLGHGSLAHIDKFARVEVQRVDADDNVVKVDYIGFITTLDTDGPECRLPLGGQAAGRLSADDYWPPAVFKRAHDCHFLLNDLLRSHGVVVKGTTDTGVSLTRRGGGNALDEFSRTLNILSALGVQQTVMPNQNSVYRLHDKDTTTVDATVYFDGELATQRLSSSALEEPDVVFATGRTKNGELVNFAVAPGAVQGTPPAFPGAFGSGDTDADTTSGDGVSVAQQQLAAVLQAFSIDDVTLGTCDTATVDAIEDLQDRRDLTVTGAMNSATWDALWSIGADGFSLDQARIVPAAQRGYVPKWNLSANGSKMGRNRRYVPRLAATARHRRHRRRLGLQPTPDEALRAWLARTPGPHPLGRHRDAGLRAHRGRPHARRSGDERGREARS
jgi:hypothetical protein